MGLVDVFTKWCLDRVNEIFLKRKDYSVEERTKILHSALKVTEDLSDLTEVKSRAKRFKLRKDVAYLKKRIWTEHFTGLRGIGLHAKELEFYFEQNGFPQLIEQIGNLIGDVVGIPGRLRMTLSEQLWYIRRKDKDGILRNRRMLVGFRTTVSKMLSACEMVEKTLISFSRRIDREK
jgi:hypothetical protein